MRGMEFFPSIPMRLRVTTDSIGVVREDEFKKFKDWRKAYKKLKGDNKSISFYLDRWVDMKEHSFYSGDGHVHGRYQGQDRNFSEEELFDIIVAEDLNVANMMIANDLGSIVYDYEMFTGEVHPLSNSNYKMMWNQELRNNHLGHLILHNLNELVSPLYSGFLGAPDNFSYLPDSELAEYDVPNIDWVDKAHKQHANVMVEYTHPIINFGLCVDEDLHKLSYDMIPDMMELPVDVAFGKIDGINVYTYPSNNKGSLHFWYRLLNTGHNLTATAGTDSFVGSRLGPYLVNPYFSQPPGGLRTYVSIPNSHEFSYDNYVRFAKLGKTFVTNGPMFTEFNLEQSNQVFSAGEEVKSTRSNNSYKVNFSVTSMYPVLRWTIVVNGRAYASEAVDLQRTQRDKDGRTYYQFDVSRNISFDQSSWVAVELEGDKHTWAFDGFLQAHTSPIYITINNEKRQSAVDAAYFVKRISYDMRYVADLGYFQPGTNQKRRLLELFEEGCRIYERQQFEEVCESAESLL